MPPVTTKNNGKVKTRVPAFSEVMPPRPGGQTTKLSSVELALELISTGHTEISAIAKLRNTCNISLEQAQAALEEAYQKIEATHASRTPSQQMALALEQRGHIIASAFDSSDHRIALSAMEQREKLLGLSGPDALQENTAASNLLQLMELAINSGSDNNTEDSE